MKSTLAPGLKAQKKITVDEGRCISFMGREAMVYATPRMVSDMEYFCRDFLLAHLDAGEDSVGTHVSIDHLAATPLGMNVTLSIEVTALDRRKVEFSFSAHDGLDECGKGKHVRFVVESAKTQERLAAKRAKAGLK
jgi:fluoroacetyl-CoA thioesterase